MRVVTACQGSPRFAAGALGGGTVFRPCDDLDGAAAPAFPIAVKELCDE
jgi:hypothetical protein